MENHIWWALGVASDWSAQTAPLETAASLRRYSFGFDRCSYFCTCCYASALLYFSRYLGQKIMLGPLLKRQPLGVAHLLHQPLRVATGSTRVVPQLLKLPCHELLAVHEAARQSGTRALAAVTRCQDRYALFEVGHGQTNTLRRLQAQGLWGPQNVGDSISNSPTQAPPVHVRQTERGVGEDVDLGDCTPRRQPVSITPHLNPSPRGRVPSATGTTRLGPFPQRTCYQARRWCVLTRGGCRQGGRKGRRSHRTK